MDSYRKILILLRNDKHSLGGSEARVTNRCFVGERNSVAWWSWGRIPWHHIPRFVPSVRYRGGTSFSTHIFHLKILGARRATLGKLLTKGPQTISATVQNVVATAT